MDKCENKNCLMNNTDCETNCLVFRNLSVCDIYNRLEYLKNVADEKILNIDIHEIGNLSLAGTNRAIIAMQERLNKIINKVNKID